MSDNKKSIDDALAKINKTYGLGTISRFDDKPLEKIEVVSTGSLGLDMALGVGGFPKGRIIEIYGPESSGKTTIAIHAIAEAQKKGGVCAFIDAEHAFDPIYAENIGVNIKELIFSQPNNGEEAMEVVDTLLNTKGLSVIVVDSVAALVPKAELDGEMGDSKMGLHARLMSQAMRKLTPIVSKSNCVVIFINQLRMKIGVMFGCFNYNARVLLEDGTTEKIGKIVNGKLDVKVMSYNKEKGVIEPKKIINHFNNGKGENFFNIFVNYPHISGKSCLPIADNHKIFTPNGEIDAVDLKVGDEVLVKSKKYLNDIQFEYLIGTFLGDASIKSTNGNTSKLILTHGVKQNDYCIWKRNIFNSNFIEKINYTSDGKAIWTSKTTNEFTFLKKYKSGSSIRFVDKELLDLITLRSIALWYLDDGNFSGSYKKYGKGKSNICFKNMSLESKELINQKFLELGIYGGNIDNKIGIFFYGNSSYEFHKKIAKFVPKCMSYKIHPDFHNILETDILINDNLPIDILIPAKIFKIQEKNVFNSTNKFDIEVEDNSNYFVDNVLVHNSPETTTGGEALKFYASVRLDVRRSSQIKDGDEITGNKTKVKIIKNKVAPPFKTAEFDIVYGEGINRDGEILDLAVELEIIQKSGSWFSYGSTKLGQGRESVVNVFKDNPDMVDEILEKINTLIRG